MSGDDQRKKIAEEKAHQLMPHWVQLLGRMTHLINANLPVDKTSCNSSSS